MSRSSAGAIAAAAVVAAVVIGWQAMAGSGSPGQVVEPSPAGTVSAAPATPAVPAPPVTSSTSTPAVAGVGVGSEAAQRDVLQRVIPVWASADLASIESRLSPTAWVATWRGLPGVGQGFVRASQEEFAGGLFGGAIRLNVSVKDARVTSARRLWVQGEKAMWRVEVTRSVSSNEGVKALDGVEKVGWDVTVTGGDGGPQVSGFASPSVANEKPPASTSTSSSSSPGSPGSSSSAASSGTSGGAS